MIKRLLILATLLFACGGDQVNKTIEFWQFWTDPKARPVIESVVDQFEKENPGWTVNVTDLTWADGHQKIVVAFGADNPPDILELGSDWIAEFAAGHALAKIEIDTSKFMLTEPGIFEGDIYAQPWFLASRILYFNKTLLEKAKLDIPVDWQQLREACLRIDALNEEISGFGANSAEPHRLYKKFLPFVWSSGGDIIEDGKILIDTPEVLRALEFYSGLTRCARIETQRHLEDAFIEGNIGFLISGGWFHKRLKQTPPNFEYQLVQMIPEEKAGTGWSFSGGEYLVIPYKSEKKQAALKLMEMITRIDNVNALCDSVGFGYPPHKANPADSSSLLFKQLMSSRSTPVHPRWIYIETIIENMVEQVMLGEISPRQAIKDAQTSINETLNR
ncbi:MAG: extracellular solute-binding protein [candidate division Zixibacteria bacterium]|nr:extracellular solute-binding protein [candidate division Zixibacteria bacterium]